MILAWLCVFGVLFFLVGLAAGAASTRRWRWVVAFVGMAGVLAWPCYVLWQIAT